jgi:hypothetical protein
MAVRFARSVGGVADKTSKNDYARAGIKSFSIMRVLKKGVLFPFFYMRVYRKSFYGRRKRTLA